MSSTSPKSPGLSLRQTVRSHVDGRAPAAGSNAPRANSQDGSDASSSEPDEETTDASASDSDSDDGSSLDLGPGALVGVDDGPLARLVGSSQAADAGEAPESRYPPPGDFFRSAEWTADGTSIVTTTSTNAVSTYILPPDLLSPSTTLLRPYSTVLLPEPSPSLALSPYFSLSEPQTQLFLAGPRDHPVQVRQLFPSPGSNGLLGTYKLYRAETEQFITPTSMIWPSPNHFFTGSKSRLCVFDVKRVHEDPVAVVKTAGSKGMGRSGVSTMKGVISALSQDPAVDGRVAAGTWGRTIGIYDLFRAADATTCWSIKTVAEQDFKVSAGGSGVAQTSWSPCSRYLIVGERDSTALIVYDMRTHWPLALLAGRKARETQQKLGFDVVSNRDGGFDVWAGNMDGSVTVWEGVDGLQGVARGKEWRPHGRAPVGSTAFHASGSVLATCSGGWTSYDDQEIGRPGPASETGVKVLRESCLRIWSLDGGEADREEQDDQTECGGE